MFNVFHVARGAMSTIFVSYLPLVLLSLVLIHCYYTEGFGSKIISPLSGTLIEYLGTMFVDDMDIFVSLSELKDSITIYKEMQVSMWYCGVIYCV